MRRPDNDTGVYRGDCDMTYLTTIEQYDVGEKMLHRGTGNIFVGNVIGRVQPRDIGKRVFITDGIVAVENDDQKERRAGQ